MLNRTIERKCLCGHARAIGTFAYALSAVADSTAAAGMEPQCGRTSVIGGSA